MCRSPLPNRIQPSAIRWRVGRSPTSRSIDLTSCHGQPVSVERGATLASRSVPSTALANTMVRDGGIGTPEPFTSEPFGTSTRLIVAFVTYRPQDATPSQQHWGNSNLGNSYLGERSIFSTRADPLGPLPGPKKGAAAMRRKPALTGFAPRIAYVRTSMTSGIEQSAKDGRGWRTGAQASDTMSYWRARGASCLARAM